MSKVTGEMWCNYYNQRYDVDVRSVRYPGIIGHQSMPGGGTTDYAVEIYHEALKTGSYECFLSENTRLPDFKITYKPDFRQKIAESWTESIDDQHARKDWKWKHEYDLDKITETMLSALKPRYSK